MDHCIFCDIINQKIPADIIDQTHDILVIKDHAPQAPVHYLIIPKKHIQDIQALDPADCCLSGKIVAMAKKLSQTSPDVQDFKLLINNGYKAGQRVFHLHAHFLAGSLS
jgi:histidine triad (HIT) family protein